MIQIKKIKYRLRFMDVDSRLVKAIIVELLVHNLYRHYVLNQTLISYIGLKDKQNSLFHHGIFSKEAARPNTAVISDSSMYNNIAEITNNYEPET